MNVQVRASQTLTTEIVLGDHRLLADEPQRLGGENRGPTPHDLLLASLASCTAITIMMYANRQGWDCDVVEVGVEREQSDEGADRYVLTVAPPRGLSADKVARLMHAAARCPVRRVLNGPVAVTERLDSLSS